MRAVSTDRPDHPDVHAALGLGVQRVQDLRVRNLGVVDEQLRLRPVDERDELLAGGSLYWVIKGIVTVRQKLMDLREGKKPDGTPCCLLILDRKLVPVRPVPRRAFQGWRYLADKDAPRDLTRIGQGLRAMPEEMRRELRDLGLI